MWVDAAFHDSRAFTLTKFGTQMISFLLYWATQIATVCMLVYEGLNNSKEHVLRLPIFFCLLYGCYTANQRNRGSWLAILALVAFAFNPFIAVLTTNLRFYMLLHFVSAFVVFVSMLLLKVTPPGYEATRGQPQRGRDRPR